MGAAHQNDKQFVLVAVSSCGSALGCASKELQKDPELVRAARESATHPYKGGPLNPKNVLIADYPPIGENEVVNQPESDVQSIVNVGSLNDEVVFVIDDPEENGGVNEVKGSNGLSVCGILKSIVTFPFKLFCCIVTALYKICSCIVTTLYRFCVCVLTNLYKGAMSFKELICRAICYCSR